MKYIILCIIGLLFISGCTQIQITPVTPVVTPPCCKETQNVTVQNLTVTYIDVGQGDSEYIVSPHGNTMLIDAGESNMVSKVTSVVKNKNIDFVVATHPHADHIGGMMTVLSTYTIGEFIDSGYPDTTKTYKDMISTISSKHIPLVTVKNGIGIDYDQDVSVTVLNPQPKFFNDINDNSIVLLMKYRNVSFLFTGDAGLNAETLYAKQLGKIDVLKVGHHGSVTATGPYLLSKIHPSISIISVGEGNSYGHPDASTLQHLEKDGSTIYRTDLNGTITITTNGEQYSVIESR